jgi:hypothetical protein
MIAERRHIQPPEPRTSGPCARLQGKLWRQAGLGAHVSLRSQQIEGD